MYEAYWQLETKPFESSADARFYYPGETQQGALLKLRYAIENRRHAVVLAGASGLGKTLLIKMLAGQLAPPLGPLVHLVFPQMPAANLLGYVAAELGASEATGRDAELSLDRAVRAIQARLADIRRAGGHVVLAVDEAHLLDGYKTLEALRLILNFEVDGQPALTMLLVGQTSLLVQLSRMPHFEERVALKSLLKPFTSAETASYVQHRLMAAGAKRTIFEPDAYDALHALSLGVPRRLNRLCDLALLVGFAEEQHSLSAANIESVGEELLNVVAESGYRIAVATLARAWAI